MKQEHALFSTSKFAKEKGFTWGAYSHYILSLTEQIDEQDGKSGPFGWGKDELSTNDGYFINNHKDVDRSNEVWYMCSRPTQSILQKWLREEHNIQITIDTHVLLPPDSSHMGTDLGYRMITNNSDGEIVGGTVFATYEESLEEGLIEALKLIK